MKTKLSERELVQWDPELVIRTTYLLYLQLIQDYTCPMTKLVLCRRVTPLPKLPSTSCLFLHFLTKLGKPFTLETKNLVRLEQMTCLAGFPSPLSWTNFSGYKLFSSPSWINSVKERQTVCTRALFSALGSGKGVHWLKALNFLY